MTDISITAFSPQTTRAVSHPARAPEGAQGEHAAKTEKKGFSFGDFLDVINPLHHIPVVGQVYRAITGDEISDKARLAGGGLFAGPLGIGIAAGTIALRDGKKAETPLEQPETMGQVKSTPIHARLDQSLEAYNAIAQQHWTEESLSALARSLAPSEASTLKQAARDEDQPARADQERSLGAVPTPRVNQRPLDGSSALASPVMAQMLSNLEKLDALNTPAPR